MVEVGIPGHSTCLYGAMCFASEDIVVALLEAGADVEATDVMGNDSFMAACGMGRLDNVKVWFSCKPDWNVNSRNKMFGATALNIALALGVRNLELVRYLLKRGSNLLATTYTGNSCLHDISMNQDCDPHVLRHILQHMPYQMILKRKCGVQTKWKIILKKALIKSR